MRRRSRFVPAHPVPGRVMLAVILTGAVGAFALAGMAIAKTFTLNVAKRAPVTNQHAMTSRENVVVNSRGRAVYTLSGDSQSHPKCTRANGCFGFWPPVKVGSRHAGSRAAGIKGKLGTWHRNGFWQVTLNGHPLYTFSGDHSRDHATGEGIVGFGGTWHVVRPAAANNSASAPSNPAPPNGSMTSTTPTTPAPPTYPTY